MRYESGLASDQVEDILSQQKLCELIQRTQNLLGEKFKQGLKFTPDQEMEYSDTITAIKKNNYFRKYLAANFREELLV